MKSAYVMVAVFLNAGALSCGGATKPKTPLTFGTSFAPYGQPAWKPDGTRLVFNHTPVLTIRDPATGRITFKAIDSLAGLWTIDVNGTGERRISPYGVHDPDWNSNGTELVFERGASIWRSTVSDTALDDSGAIKLSGNLKSFSPTWRPGNAQVTYSVDIGPGAGLYLVTASGAPVRAFGSPGWSMPEFSPDGRKLAFQLALTNRSAVCVVDTLGGNLVELWSGTGALVWFPRWSPDGSRIAFMVKGAGSSNIQLWLINSDGTGPRQITSTGCSDFFSWGPDSKRIAYVRYSSTAASITNGTIWTINVDTGQEQQLTSNPPPPG
jgi:Tol biopolymer transport system component